MSDDAQRPAGSQTPKRNEHERTAARQTSNADGSRSVELQHVRFQGPLPVPELLAGYEDVLPGLADRIVCMAEKEQNHQIEIQRLEIDEVRVENMREHHRGVLGQVFAFLLAIFAVGGSFYLVAIEKQVAGALSGVVSLGALIGAFFYDRHSKNVATEKQSAPIPEPKGKPARGANQQKR